MATLRPKADDEKLGDLDTAEAHSLLKKLGLGTLSTIGYIAETLDKPGAAIRGLIAGKPEQLANLIPFSDALGITRPEERVSGRQLLQGMLPGLVPQKSGGLDWWDVPGIALEIFTDPLIFVSGPAKSGLKGTAQRGTREAGIIGAQTYRRAINEGLSDVAARAEAIKAIENMPPVPVIGKGATRTRHDIRELSSLGVSPIPGHLANPAAMAEEIAAGERALFSVRVPFTDTRIGFFTGVGPAKLYEKLHYNPITAVFQERFSPGHEGLKTAKEHYLADLRRSLQFLLEGEASVSMITLARQMLRSRAELVSIFGLPDEKLEAMGDIVEAAMAEFIERKGGAMRLAKEAMSERLKLDEVPARFQKTVQDILDAKAHKDTARVKRLRDLLRIQLLDEAADKSLAFLREELARAGVAAPSAFDVRRAYRVLDAVSAHARTLLDNVHRERARLGGSPSYYLGYWPRRASPEAAEALRHELNILEPEWQATKGNPRQWKRRRRKWLDEAFVHGATTETVHRISMDPLITVSNRELVRALDDFWMADTAQKAIDLRRQSNLYANTYPERFRLKDGTIIEIPALNAERAKDYLVKQYGLNDAAALYRMLRSLRAMPAAVLKNGLFGRNAIGVLADVYVKQMADLANLQFMHSMLDDTVEYFVNPPASWHSLRHALKNTALGVNIDKAIDAFIARNRSRLPPINPKHLKHRLYIPDEVARSMIRLSRKVYSPDATNFWVRLFDGFQSLWKAFSTTLGGVPGFQVRNFLTGQWYNMMTAYSSPAQGLRALRRAANVLAGRDPEILDLMRLHRVLEGLQVDDILNTLRGSGTDVQELVQSTNPLAALAKIVENAQKGIEEGMARGRFEKSPLAGAGYAAMNVLVGRKRLGHPREGGIVEIGTKLNRLVEGLNRGSHFIAQLENGLTPFEAARSAVLAHFDYGDLNRFEKQYMRRIMPFYTFTRKNIPTLLRMMIDDPGGGVAQTVRVVSRLRTEGSKGENPLDSAMFLPDWLGEGTVIRLGGSGDDRMKAFFAEYGLIPTSDLNILPFSGGRPNWQRMGEETLARLSPLITAPLAITTGRHFWSGRDLSELEPWPLDKQPVMNYLINNILPTGRISRRIRDALDARKPAWQRLVNQAVGGVRMATIDTERHVNKKVQEILARMLGRAKGMREFRTYYISNPDKATAETIELYRLYNTLKKRYRRYLKEYIK